MARECIFCGGPANSREDVWPCWLTSRFIAPGTMEAERRPDLQMRSWRVDRPELVVRRVCEPCNNGWMSRLQSRSKPIIEQLWDQPEVTLNVYDCKSLSLWAAMTAMVLQTFDDQNQWLYSEYDLTLMWHEQRIPRFTGIWIAQCIGHTETYSQGRSMSATASGDSQRRARGNVVTMAFGNVAIQVLKVVPEDDAWRLEQITVSQGWGDWENIALQLWPLTGKTVEWPPPRAIRHETELEQFAARFRARDDDATAESPPSTD